MSTKHVKNGIERSIQRAGIRMIIPSMLIITVFVLYPIIKSFYMSLYDWNIIKNSKLFLGLGNYLRAFNDERFLNAFKNTVIYTVLYVPILVILSLIFATLLSYDFKGSKAFKAIIFLPAITSMAIIAIIFRFLLDGDIGLISIYLKNMGFKVKDLLREPDSAMGMIIFVGVWRWIGFNMVIILAGLNSIPESLYESAEIDGAGKVKQFFSITLPLLAPTLSFTIITNLISSFQVFDQVYVMTKGGPLFSTEVLVYYIYYRGFNVFEMGYSSSMAFILFIVILLITMFQLKSFKKAENNGDYS